MRLVARTQRVLPDISTLDSDRLRVLVVEQYQQLVSHDQEIENLKLFIQKLQRMQFGPSSERITHHIGSTGAATGRPGDQSC